jgi:3-phenylpropionate/trans-cinnamate dioxygenase ferredoxin reductase subunit
MAYLEKTIMVVGGGLLACESAASLRMMKMKVGLMHRDTYLLNRYVDPETGAWLTDFFTKHGVVLSMGEALNGFEGKTVLRNIQTKSGNRFPVGLAVVACGAEPNLDLVRNTPLAGPHGSPVTEYLETEEKGIYAIGDLAFYPDRIMGGMRRQTHWENAREQGLVAGANMTGKKRIRYEQVPYFWTEMFDLRMDFVGDFTLQPTRVNLDGTYPKKNSSLGIIKGRSSVGFFFASTRSAKSMRPKASCVRRKANKNPLGLQGTSSCHSGSALHRCR